MASANGGTYWPAVATSEPATGGLTLGSAMRAMLARQRFAGLPARKRRSSFLRLIASTPSKRAKGSSPLFVMASRALLLSRRPTNEPQHTHTPPMLRTNLVASIGLAILSLPLSSQNKQAPPKPIDTQQGGMS